MVSSDVQRSEKTDKGNEFQLCSTAEKCGPVSVRKIGFFFKVKAVVKSTAQLKWMRKKTTWNPKRSLRTSWCRSSARITWMFSVSTSFCLVLDKLSNCLALADIQLLYLFLIRCDRPYFYFSIDVVLLRFCVTSNSFLSPFTFLCHITNLTFC